MIIFDIQSSFLRFCIRNIRYEKLLFTQLLSCFYGSAVCVCAFLDTVHISKNWRNFSEKKRKIFEFQSNFLSFCVRNGRYPKELFGQFFIIISRRGYLQFKVFPLSISQENYRNFSESEKFFGFQSKFLCFGFGLRVKAILVNYYGSFSPWFQGFIFFFRFFSTYLERLTNAKFQAKI